MGLAAYCINPFPRQALVFTCLQYKSYENTAEKGEIARNTKAVFLLVCNVSLLKTWLRATSPFPTVLSFLLENFPPCASNLKLSSANFLISEESKINFWRKINHLLDKKRFVSVANGKQF